MKRRSTINIRKIAVASANRAERGILEPVIRRLETRRGNGEIDFELIEVTWDYDRQLKSRVELNKNKPDVVLVPADRKEMVDLARYLYYEGVPVFHLWAGIGYTGTWDDLNRRVISSYAYLMMCEDEPARERLIASGEEDWRVIVTGTTHFDDLEIDDKLVPGAEFELLLVNPNDPFEDWGELMQQAEKARDHSIPAVWVSNNEGRQFASDQRIYSNVPRAEFLGLLKNCKRFISNSSSAVYEALYFGVEVVHIGQRNRERKITFVKYPRPVTVSSGPNWKNEKVYSCASDYIVDLLCNFPIEKSKMLKVYGR